MTQSRPSRTGEFPENVTYPSRRPAMCFGYMIRNPPKAFAFALANDLLSAALVLRARPVPATQRILVALAGHLGDAILALPTLFRLREVYPSATIGVLLSSWQVPALGGAGGVVDHVHIHDHPALIRSRSARPGPLAMLWQWAAIRREINAQGYQTSIDLISYLENWTPFLWTTNVPSRIGWKSGGFEALQTHTVPRIDADRHNSDYPRDLLEVLDPAFRQPLRPRYLHDGPAVWPFGIDRAFTVMHIGTGGEIKEWEDIEWRRLAERLVRAGDRIVVCGQGRREVDRAAMVVQGLGDSAIDLSGQLDWSGFVGLVATSRQLICLDSAAQHLAAGLGKRVIVIAGGMTNMAQYGPGTPDGTVITAYTPCQVCYRAQCGLRHCLTLTTAEDVASLLEKATGPLGR